MHSVRYVSASGSVLNLTNGGYNAIGTGLPAWSYEVITMGNSLAGFNRGMPEYEFGVNIVCDSDSDGVAARNALHDIPAKDRENKTPGRLYFDDWYIRGYVTASTVDNFWQTRAVAEYVLKFVATDPKWTKETTNPMKGTSSSDSGMDYPYDMPTDYGSVSNSATVSNCSVSESPILLRLYGSATNPSVTIGGNVYRVNLTINSGEYVEIDGLHRTATLVKADGTTENVFSKLYGDMTVGSGKYAFQPIPNGVSEVSWNSCFDLDVVVFERRDEPRWT